jgi:hypothetical protein
MILPKKGSRQHIVNIFSEFILNQFPINSNTYVDVVDCKNFYIVKGKTNSKSIINLNDVSESFKEKFSDLVGKDFRINLIDLIEYDVDLTQLTELEFSFYKSQNNVFHSDQIKRFEETNESTGFCLKPFKFDDDESFIFSEFPYGYSLNLGRKLFFLSKKISCEILTNHNLDSIFITSKLLYDEISVDIYSSKNLSFNVHYKLSDLIENNISKLEFEDILNPLSEIKISE